MIEMFLWKIEWSRLLFWVFVSAWEDLLKNETLIWTCNMTCEVLIARDQWQVNKSSSTVLDDHAHSVDHFYKDQNILDIVSNISGIINNTHTVTVFLWFFVADLLEKFVWHYCKICYWYPHCTCVTKHSIWGMMDELVIIRFSLDCCWNICGDGPAVRWSWWWWCY